MEEGGVYVMYIEDKKSEIPDISSYIRKAPVTKIVEELDCFTPRRFITIEYSGQNVREVARQAPRILRRGMMITGTRVFIDDYYVDVTDPNNIVFHIFWHGYREFDDKSKMWGWVRLKHGVVHPDGTGSVRIEFYSKLVTTWDRGSILQRNPIYALLMKIYQYIYYDEQRRKYVDQCKEYTEDMIRRMKEMLKLMETAQLSP
jgi:hypothetical protein